MKNRLIGLIKHKESSPDELNTFFLACEFKPNAPMFSILSSFAYDIQPAFIHGSLGVIAYEPESYAIIDADENGMPLIGYILTITEPDTVSLLNKLKGYLGPNAFNFHHKKIVQAFIDVNVSKPAWVFQLSEYVLESYSQIEQVELGLTNEDDEVLMEFLEKIGEAL